MDIEKNEAEILASVGDALIEVCRFAKELQENQAATEALRHRVDGLVAKRDRIPKWKRFGEAADRLKAKGMMSDAEGMLVEALLHKCAALDRSDEILAARDQARVLADKREDLLRKYAAASDSLLSSLDLIQNPSDPPDEAG
jgi:hypothetical protein